MLSTSIALNAVSNHATCTVVFVVVAVSLFELTILISLTFRPQAVVAALLASIQTLSRVSILGWVGLVSIFASIITVCAAVGVQDRPSLAPPAPELFDKNLRAFGSPTFAQAANSLGTIVFAYGEPSLSHSILTLADLYALAGAVPASFNLVAEMRRPLDFTKTAAVAQSFITAVSSEEFGARDDLQLTRAASRSDLHFHWCRGLLLLR